MEWTHSCPLIPTIIKDTIMGCWSPKTTIMSRCETGHRFMEQLKHDMDVVIKHIYICIWQKYDWSDVPHIHWKVSASRTYIEVISEFILSKSTSKVSFITRCLKSYSKKPLDVYSKMDVLYVQNAIYHKMTSVMNCPIWLPGNLTDRIVLTSKRVFYQRQIHIWNHYP